MSESHRALLFFLSLGGNFHRISTLQRLDFPSSQAGIIARISNIGKIIAIAATYVVDLRMLASKASAHGKFPQKFPQEIGED